MLDAFRLAAELAPENIPFGYRYCEAHYDLENPDWAAALASWQALGARLTAPIEQQTVRLHEANVLLRQNKAYEAQVALATVTDDRLAVQKQKLIAQLPAAGEK